MQDLVPELRLFALPAAIFDKHVYSPWMETKLHGWLRERRINTLVITGGETDVCVLAAVMGAIDLGYRVVVVKDGIWSSADETHGKMVDVSCERFQLQLEAADMEVILRAWNVTWLGIFSEFADTPSNPKACETECRAAALASGPRLRCQTRSVPSRLP